MAWTWKDNPSGEEMPEGELRGFKLTNPTLSLFNNGEYAFSLYHKSGMLAAWDVADELVEKLNAMEAKNERVG
jgi:hypothetical protein